MTELTRRTVVTAVVAVLTTAVVLLLAQNLLPGATTVDQRVEHLYDVRDPQFRRTMGRLLGPPVVAGVEVRHLENGDEIFPAMLEAIRSAEETITFETFVFWRGEIARQFTEALAERARAGIAVHVLLDWVGFEGAEDELIRRMREAGAEVEFYNPLEWWQLDEMNNRTHRKILVVDGEVGFTGGVGIADEWQGDARDDSEWRDSHFRVEGPVVGQMQAAFLDNWLKVRPRVLHSDRYFPPLDRVGDAAAQMFLSSPEEGGDSMRLMYMLAIAAAQREILIATPYFVPDDLLARALVDAMERGVEIDVVVPGGEIDQPSVRRASRARWGPLLEAGVRIHEYQPTMFHTKLLVVDDAWTSVGSTNFDNRSFRLNDEANLNVFDEEFAAEMGDVFRRDLEHSREVTLAEWRSRPWREKLAERATSLFGSQL